MQIEQELFIVTRLDGFVAIHSLTTFQHLCYLNDPKWDSQVFFRFSLAFKLGKAYLDKRHDKSLPIPCFDKALDQDKFELIDSKTDRTTTSHLPTTASKTASRRQISRR